MQRKSGDDFRSKAKYERKIDSKQVPREKDKNYFKREKGEHNLLFNYSLILPPVNNK